MCELVCFFFFQAEDGIRDLVRSRGLGDVYKRQPEALGVDGDRRVEWFVVEIPERDDRGTVALHFADCLLYTSDAADERSSVDLGGRRIIKKKKSTHTRRPAMIHAKTMTNTSQ